MIMESSSSRRSLHPHTPARATATSRRRFQWRQVERAIRGKSCPICLSHITDGRRAAVITSCLHAYCLNCITSWSDLKRRCPLCNADFDAWFFKIDLPSRTFLRQQLPALGAGRKVCTGAHRRRRMDPIAEQRVIRRSREEFNCFSWQTRPLPRQRWFGRSESESSDAVARRVLQWRASIYEQHLRAVPCFYQSNREQRTGNTSAKERILKRIEPWIRRELEAVLGDPDPSVIVHVASALFISSLEEKREVSCEQSDLENNYLEPLRPFLHERTNMFWHELRCFAESPFNMETYDTIVEYRKLSE